MADSRQIIRNRPGRRTLARSEGLYLEMESLKKINDRRVREFDLYGAASVLDYRNDISRY